MIKKEDCEKLIVSLTENIRREPEKGNLYRHRGNCHLKLNKYEKAISDFTEAICLEPDLPDNYLFRGAAYEEIGDLRKAIADYSEHLFFERKNMYLSYLRRGVCYCILRQDEKAIEDLTKAIHLKPTLADAYFFRAVCYEEAGQTHKAEEDYLKSIKLKQRNYLAIERLSEIWQRESTMNISKQH